jgi:hypothetical protein
MYALSYKNSEKHCFFAECEVIIIENMRSANCGPQNPQFRPCRDIGSPLHTDDVTTCVAMRSQEALQGAANIWQWKWWQMTEAVFAWQTGTKMGEVRKSYSYSLTTYCTMAAQLQVWFWSYDNLWYDVIGGGTVLMNCMTRHQHGPSLSDDPLLDVIGGGTVLMNCMTRHQHGPSLSDDPLLNVIGAEYSDDELYDQAPTWP